MKAVDSLNFLVIIFTISNQSSRAKNDIVLFFISNLFCKI